MITAQRMSNRKRLVASAVTLSAVLITAAVVERHRRSAPVGDQTRYRSFSDEAEGRSRATSSSVKPANQTSVEPTSTNSGADEATAKAEINRFLDRWRTTLLRGDLTAHAACYAPVVDRYFRQRRVPRAQVLKDKKQMTNLWPDLRIYDISDIRVEKSQAGRTVVTFRKDWDARSSTGRKFTGSEKERLTLVGSSGSWQIMSEEELKVYRLSRR